MNDLVTSGNRVSTVGSWELYHFLRMLTPFFSGLREPNGCIDGCPDFFRRISPPVTNAPSLYPVCHDAPRYHADMPSLY